jgi:flagellar hook-associated protein 2
MSSAGISFGGLGSGLDSRSIIEALMAVERRPISALEAKKTAIGRQKSLFGDLDKLLGDLQDKARALQRTTEFLAMQAASDKEEVLMATAGNTATPGSWRLTVERLATAQVSASAGRADRAATQLGDGTFEITVDGTSHFVSVGAGTGYDSTLDGIAAAINAAAIGVNASVVDTGVGTDRYQLVLSGSTTGSDGAFTVALDSGPQALQTLVGELATPVTAAQNARISMNGIGIERSTNQITDVIPGVTLDLRTTQPSGEFVTITVSTDAEATSTKVKEFVDAYNKVVDFLAEQNALGADGKAKGPLFGDTTLRSVRGGLRDIVGGVVGNGPLRLLAQIGITSDTAGKLTFDQSRFEQQLVDDEAAVAGLFTNATDGIARRLFDRIDLYTDSVDGLLKTRTDGFDRLTKQTQSRIDQAERRLAQYEKSLEQRYANLETLMARLQGQGSSLGVVSSATRR